MKKIIAFLLSAIMFAAMFVITAPAESVNLIKGKTGTAVNGSAESGLELLTDGKKGTKYWDEEPELYCKLTTNIDGSEWVGWAEYFAFVEYDLGEATTLTAVNVVCNGAPWDVLVLTSEDGETWTKQASAGSLQQNYMEEDTEIITVPLTFNATARYVRVGFGASNGYAIAVSEIEVIGEGTAVPENSVPESSSPADESVTDESKEPATPSQPADTSNLIIFAGIALSAIAGSAVVIRKRG